MNQDRTIELVSLALDAALMRQSAIANNIANSNTPGYESIGVNFEQQLSENKDLTEVNPVYEHNNNQTSIDQQMALNVQNITQYRALIKGLNHKLSVMKLALQGNNQ